MRSTSKLIGVAQTVALCVALSACSAQSGDAIGLPGGANVLPEFDATPLPWVHSEAVSAKSAVPVVGGTLLTTSDGRTIAAADPDRDAVFLVDATSHRVTPVQLQAGDEPGRVAEGPKGIVYVALRRGSAVVAIDLASASIARRASVCAAPRGLAYDSKTSSVYVACRSGLLLTLDASTLSVTRTLKLDPDLRDVLVRERDLVVTRYLSAEVLVVADDGSVSRRATPQPAPGCGTATVLSRALALPNGQIALAHQVSSDDTVDVNNGGYGFSSCGGGLVTRAVGTVDVDSPSQVPVTNSRFGGPIDQASDASKTVSVPMTFQSMMVPAAGPLDIAIDAQSGQLALIALDTSTSALVAGIVSPGGPSKGRSAGGSVLLNDTPGASLWIAPLSAASPGTFMSATESVAINGQPVAVAFNAGSYIVQSREPATLEFQDGSSVSLSNESHADTGHLLFHMDSGIGISCASCHPEGGEDGHVWHFPDGLRRTLPLEGGVLSRAPFHWDGTLADMSTLFNEVMVKRMNLGVIVSEPQIATLGSFLDRIPALSPPDGLDYAAVSRGQALFSRADVACASCHSGAQYTDNRLNDVGTGGKFVTPSLLGVGSRSPIFHDGCAISIAQRFGPCGGAGHGKVSLLSTSEQADLIEFMRSL